MFKNLLKQPLPLTKADAITVDMVAAFIIGAYAVLLIQEARRNAGDGFVSVKRFSDGPLG